MAIPPELQEKIDEHTARMGACDEWKVSDLDIIPQYAKNFNDFKSLLKGYIQWHVNVIGKRATDPVAAKEDFERRLGIDVQTRTITQQ